MKFCQTSDHVFDVQYSPDGSRVACSLVTGYIEIFNVSTSSACSTTTVPNDENADQDQKTTTTATTATASSCSSSSPTKVGAWKRHKESCRTIRYYGDNRLLSCASNGSIGCGPGEDFVWIRRHTGTGVNSLLTWGEHCFVYGDDKGSIGAYDMRIESTKGPIMEFSEQSDFISSMIWGTKDGAGADRAAGDPTMLVAGCGDSTLGVYDVRMKRLHALSDEQEDEILSLELLKGGDKVVCGGQTGILSIFSWGDFGDQKDRIVGHPASVDCMVRISEDALVTGCEDGKLRVVSVYAQAVGNRILSVVGDHGDDPVQGLTIRPSDGKEIASCGMDNMVRFWSTDEALSALETDKERPSKKPKVNPVEQKSNTQKMQAKAFFSDL